jgi:hypothetical protein
MKLTTVKFGFYVCESDRLLEFRRPREWTPYGTHLGSGWEFRQKYTRRRHHFATLAEATDFARPLWRPRFLERALWGLHGDGQRLWQDAVLGDRQSFKVLLDWIDDNLPNCRDDYSDRDEVLKQAERCGLFRPRRKR